MPSRTPWFLCHPSPTLKYHQPRKTPCPTDLLCKKGFQTRAGIYLFGSLTHAWVENEHPRNMYVYCRLVCFYNVPVPRIMLTSTIRQHFRVVHDVLARSSHTNTGLKTKCSNCGAWEEILHFPQSSLRGAQCFWMK